MRVQTNVSHPYKQVFHHVKKKGVFIFLMSLQHLLLAQKRPFATFYAYMGAPPTWTFLKRRFASCFRVGL